MLNTPSPALSDDDPIIIINLQLVMYKKNLLIKFQFARFLKLCAFALSVLMTAEIIFPVTRPLCL